MSALLPVTGARTKTTTDEHFLALVVRLKTYQRLGYFPKLDEVPEVVIAHVRGRLDLPESVAAEVDSARSAKRHRAFVREKLGVVYKPAVVREIAEKVVIRDIAGSHMFDNGNKRMAQAIVEQLMQRNNIISGPTSADLRSVIDQVATGQLSSIEDIAAALRGYR